MSQNIGYARVSTGDQDPALQMDALDRAGCVRIFTETASGALRDRPQLEAALDYLRGGDTLVVWRLDRLARSIRQLIDTVGRLDERGVNLCSLQESIDTSSATGRLVFHIFGALAEFERDLIRERTVAGLAAARARGRVVGRPRALDARAEETVRSMLRDTDIPVKEIAARMGVSTSSLYARFPGGRAAVVLGEEPGRSAELSASAAETVRAILRDTEIPVGEIATRFGISRSALYRQFPGGRAGLSKGKGNGR